MGPNSRVVLVVDDNVDARDTLAVLLSLVGFEVDEVSDGRAALEYLRDRPPPVLIVLDLRMPGVDGLQFLDVRRGQPSLARIQVLVYSGEPEWSVRGLLGDAALFQKGADPMGLIRTALSLCV